MWQTADGRRQAAGGRQQVADSGQRTTDNEQQTTKDTRRLGDQLQAVAGLQTVMRMQTAAVLVSERLIRGAVTKTLWLVVQPHTAAGCADAQMRGASSIPEASREHPENMQQTCSKPDSRIVFMQVVPIKRPLTKSNQDASYQITYRDVRREECQEKKKEKRNRGGMTAIATVTMK